MTKTIYEASYKEASILPEIYGNLLVTEKGGDGSGNFDHAGRPGQVGGSAPDKAGGKTRERKFTEHTSAHLGALIYDGRNKISELADKYGDRPQSGGYLKMRALENEVRKMEEELRARELEESDAKVRSDVADLPAGWEGSGSGIAYSKRTEITSEHGGKEKRSSDVAMDTRTKKWMVGLTSVWNGDFQKQERITYGGFPDRKSAIEYAESFHDSKKNPFARSFMRDSAPDKAEWVQFPGQRETQPILRKRS